MASETWEARFDRKVAELEPLWQAAYDAGVPRHDPLPDVTMADCIAATVADRPDAVHVAYRDEALTYRQTNEAACRVAAALAAAGVTRGDRVVVMLGNVPELIEAYMACYKAGYVVVGVNPRSTVDEMAANLADCAPAAVVAPAGRLDDLAAAAERAGAAPRIVLAVGRRGPADRAGGGRRRPRGCGGARHPRRAPDRASRPRGLLRPRGGRRPGPRAGRPARP